MGLLLSPLLPGKRHNFWRSLPLLALATILYQRKRNFNGSAGRLVTGRASSSYLYGGTYNQFKVTFKQFGIAVKWVTKPTIEAFAAVIDDKTKAIYIESIANPKYIVNDIPALAKLAHNNGIPLVVDNTFGMGGYIIKPIQLGADIVGEIVHNLTEAIGYT